MAGSRLEDLNLLGIDVGYSDVRATTGIARCGPVGFSASKTTRHWQDRSKAIGSGITFDCIAIDGPLLPEGTHPSTRRGIESAFIGGLFGKRCKPGLSDFGQGLKFREAGLTTLRQVVGNLALGRHLEPSLSVMAGLPIVEAFPNGFIGVLLPNRVYEMAPKLRRGKKFDWLYEQFVGRRLHETVMSVLGWNDDRLVARISGETDHEKRAALICLLTAGCAASGRGCAVGDVSGGWFWLPPLTLWEPWARTASIEALLPHNAETA